MCMKCDSFRALVEGLESSRDATANTLGFLLRSYTGPDDTTAEEEKASLARGSQKLDSLTPEQRTEVIYLAMGLTEYLNHVAVNVASYKAVARDPDVPVGVGVLLEASPETLMRPKSAGGMVS